MLAKAVQRQWLSVGRGEGVIRAGNSAQLGIQCSKRYCDVKPSKIIMPLVSAKEGLDVEVVKVQNTRSSAC